MLKPQRMAFSLCLLSIVAADFIPVLPVSAANSEVSLRDVFFSTVESSESQLVGKVGLMRVAPMATQQVAMDHVFRSGEKFRFLISANHSGYLYILHHSLRGEVTQLWPRPEMTDGFRIDAGRTYTIPKNPGVLEFDDSIGSEQFYIAVRSAPKVPDLSHFAGAAIINANDQSGTPPGAMNPLDDQLGTPPGAMNPIDDQLGTPPGATNPIDNQADTTVVEWVIRGDPFGEGASRGVVFDPGNKDDDLYRYFSAAPGDVDTRAMVQVMLNHK